MQITLKNHKNILLAAAAATVLLVGIVCVVIALQPAPQPLPEATGDATGTSATTAEATHGPSQGTTETQTTEITPPVREDPQTPPSGGANTDISDVVNRPTTQEITLGIDVSKYQGTIDWATVAASGVDFAMVRVGYRTLVDGRIIEDATAKYNMQEATKHGIQLGVYFFSTAINREEAVQEANWVADLISRYAITYPVAYNCEGFADSENRQHDLTISQRTEIALSFLETISNRGYTPMFYASKNELQGDSQWETSRITARYKIWVAQYPAVPYPETAGSTYSGTHAMWQYTTGGTVPGISKPVDLNVAYFGFSDPQAPQDTQPPETVAPNVEALMTFTAVNETVTAKIETNLRDIPSQGSDSTVLYKLKNGETATRIGISSSGWSKLEFGGKTYYAVSSYLTTDLNYQAPETTQPEDAIKTPFFAANDSVTAKDVVNLRTLPSVTDPRSQVVAQLKNGEVVTRTGINNDVGWSRVVYNGQTLYCVTSYLTTSAPQSTETTASTTPTD